MPKTKLVKVTVLLTEVQIKRLDNKAKKLKSNRSLLIREAINESFVNHGWTGK